MNSLRPKCMLLESKIYSLFLFFLPVVLVESLADFPKSWQMKWSSHCLNSLGSSFVVIIRTSFKLVQILELHVVFDDQSFSLPQCS